MQEYFQPELLEALICTCYEFNFRFTLEMRGVLQKGLVERFGGWDCFRPLLGDRQCQREWVEREMRYQAYLVENTQLANVSY